MWWASGNSNINKQTYIKNYQSAYNGQLFIFINQGNKRGKGHGSY